MDENCLNSFKCRFGEFCWAAIILRVFRVTVLVEDGLNDLATQHGLDS